MLKPLDIEDLSRNRWVVIECMTYGLGLTGYSILSYYIIKHLKERYESKVRELEEFIQKNYTLKTRDILDCNSLRSISEREYIRCLSMAKELNIKPNDWYDKYYSLLVISTKLISWSDITKDISLEVEGDSSILTLLYLWYCNDDELNDVLDSAYMYLYQTFSRGRRGSLESSETIIDEVRRAIIIDEDWKVSVVSF
ncbi:MAG: hypothetical protein B6V02_02650 [Thermoprotei archaeon ex4572_64]|nr:MAG: hypothetical protein B6V02_02650 [Thermoprotei archaeon ex4572_64]